MPAPALLSDPAMVSATGGCSKQDRSESIADEGKSRDANRFNALTTQPFYRKILRCVSVIPDRFHRATLHRLLAKRLFFRSLRLLVNVGMAPVVVALEIGRRGFPAQIAIDALIIDVKFARHVFGIFVRSVGHDSFALGERQP
jgi:hypothetical protein